MNPKDKSRIIVSRNRQLLDQEATIEDLRNRHEVDCLILNSMDHDVTHAFNELRKREERIAELEDRLGKAIEPGSEEAKWLLWYVDPDEVRYAGPMGKKIIAMLKGE